MKRLYLSLLMLLSVLGFATAGMAEVKTGVVVMHGRWDSPNGQTRSFVKELEKAGILVVSPEMPWSGKREYDADFATFVKETDAAVKSLRDKGAQRICVAGHSSGGVGAVYYSTRSKVDCVIAMAAAPYPTEPRYQKSIEKSLEKARKLAAAGKQDEKTTLTDSNSGNRTRDIRTTPRIFLETNEVGAPGDTMNNVGSIMPGTCVLWISTTEEAKVSRKNQDKAYEAIPASVKKEFREVEGSHIDVPEHSYKAAIEWLKK